MSVLLPAGFTLEAATGTHVAEAFRLVAAEQTAAFGFCPDTEEDVRSMLEPPVAAASTEYLVRDADGEVVQWWGVLRDPGDPITHSWVSTHPQLADTDADVLARAGWALMLDWIRASPPEGDDDILVHSGCPAGSLPSPRHLAEAGFTRERTFWEMLGPVTDDARTAPQVPGLVIEASRDVAAIHAVLNQGFVGHYGFTPTTLEDWLSVEETMAGFDPNLRYLATIDGEPAAAMLLSRRVETQGAMYVSELATLEQFRRRGVASALLAHGFEVATREGLGHLALHVDSENAHSAPAVYRRAGLEVRTAFWAYARTLSR
ncbi:GNAT family N-acetyltransferase [Nocardioides piscis]|uniref:GNAT family N-acetyltransferase n=1 Tax=Nocardioides piscis TaxID=2714938 RepID=A0A6G7YFA3_9ACTN|nr:GNAT family N-acetyltransferase [Nocardioides piscis]QIK75485.1 GNAT family N-acetyltransferase [Nocardioides piscis]